MQRNKKKITGVMLKSTWNPGESKTSKQFISLTWGYNRPYRYQVSTMHYGSISGMLRNDISLRDLIFLHVKDVSLKNSKR